MDFGSAHPPPPGKLLQIARKGASGALMEILPAADVSREHGISGDYRGQSKRRQVTVLSREAWDAACKELGVSLSWTSRRANLFVEGVHLADTTGSRIRIGSLVMKVTGETSPCEVMDLAHLGLREALIPGWRGGVTCQVVEDGRIEVGDPVELEGR